MSGTDLAIRCVDVEVSYTIASHRPLIRDMLRGKKPTAQTIDAIKGVSFDIHVGETVGVVGPNGSGKTTLLQATTGLVPIADGACLVRSVPTFLGVSAVLRNHMTGRRNIQIGLLAQGLSMEEADDLAGDVINFAELGNAIDMRMETYSSGMRARLHFSIATALSPEILLIDEALAVGDRTFREKSAQRLDEHRQASGTVILVSHNLAEIRRSCSRVIWLEQVLVVADGPTDEVLEAYEAS